MVNSGHIIGMKVREEEVRFEVSVLKRVERKVLKQFGHVLSMDRVSVSSEEGSTQRYYISEEERQENTEK